MQAVSVLFVDKQIQKFSGRSLGRSPWVGCSEKDLKRSPTEEIEEHRASRRKYSGHVCRCFDNSCAVARVDLHDVAVDELGDVLLEAIDVAYDARRFQSFLLRYRVSNGFRVRFGIQFGCKLFDFAFEAWQFLAQHAQALGFELCRRLAIVVEIGESVRVILAPAKVTSFL